MIFGPAVSTFEISSIARGYFLLDKLVKKAPVKILEAASVSPGKFFILINGDEASVDESRKELLGLAANQVIEEVFIPQLHHDVLPALYSQNSFQVSESLGIIETATVGSSLLSADFCAKNSDVKIIDIRMARGIGGKAYYFFTGKLEDVEAGIEAGVSVVAPKGTLIRSELIANPHEDFLKYFNVGESP